MKRARGGSEDADSSDLFSGAGWHRALVDALFAIKRLRFDLYDLLWFSPESIKRWRVVIRHIPPEYQQESVYIVLDKIKSFFDGWSGISPSSAEEFRIVLMADGSRDDVPDDFFENPRNVLLLLWGMARSYARRLLADLKSDIREKKEMLIENLVETSKQIAKYEELYEEVKARRKKQKIYNNDRGARI